MENRDTTIELKNHGQAQAVQQCLRPGLGKASRANSVQAIFTSQCHQGKYSTNKKY
jgi:hypothetical protein